MVLARLQQGLEQLYRVDTRADVTDFVIDAAARDSLGLARAPREQLIVHQDEGDGAIDIGLFVDDGALATLARHDPSDGLGDHNLDDFLLTLEGVSHFVYLVWRAQAGLPVSALELELQAEVDKWITCALVMERTGAIPDDLAGKLFGAVEFADDLDDDEHDRYRIANENAQRYSESLHRRFVSPGRIAPMLAELRRFYRLSLTGKLAFINQAA